MMILKFFKTACMCRFAAMALLAPIIIQSQNLPSLLLNKNINSTFSILAFDSTSQEWGVAVATNNIYVGNSTIYLRPGVGAFSVIAETNPDYAIQGFEKLQGGSSIKEAIEFTQKTDSDWYDRQVSGIDAKGNVCAFTGAALKYWMGTSNHYLGKGFVVMGNQLADGVLSSMREAYENTKGSLAERLLKSLIAGQHAGGQITGKQSAALAVKGLRNEWFNQIDLRVDNSKTPFEDLQRLLTYHYGRIKLNQAIFALKMMNQQRGSELLREAVRMVEGWNGIYSKIAMAYILSGDEQEAVRVIQKAIKENSLWKENLPTFYYLRHYPPMSGLIHASLFSLKDWCNAINFMTEINHDQEAIELATRILKKYPASSFLYYLLGKAYLDKVDKLTASDNLGRALQLDKENAEAKALFDKIK
jgi:uncharacterized Ntn-hydrolase superfamily protein